MDVRGIDEQEWPAFDRIPRVVFGGVPRPADAECKERDVERALLDDLDRCLAAVDGDEIVGGTASYAFELTVPGGGPLPAAGVTNVGVLPSHRRRGIMRRLMERQLDDVAASGDAVAILNASEAPIYGRFGYGAATRYNVRAMSPRRIVLEPAPTDRPVRMIDKEQAAPVVAPIWDACRRLRPGQVARPEVWWEHMFGDTAIWKVGGPLLVAVVDPARGDDAGGYVTYTIDHSGGWKMALDVREMVASTPEVEARLWQHLVGVDLMHEVRAEVPVDDPLALRVTDPRQVRTRELRDYLWLRVLDATLALAARWWADDIDVVLEVHDPMRPDGGAAGRFAVDGGPDGSSCSRTDAAPDVRLGVAELGALYLGDVRPSALAAVGRLEEVTAGSVEALDRAFPWSPAPFCATRF